MANHQENHEHALPSVGAYVGVFLALMVLTAITVASAALDLGWLNTPIALAVAGTKATLVMWIFMELRHAPPLTRLAAVTGVAFLAILLILFLTDYQMGRTLWTPDPPTWLDKK